MALVDANLREEQIREGEMIVTMNRYGEVCQVAKLGGVPVDALEILRCISIALVKVKEVTQFISKKLEADAASRDVDGLIAELSAENER